MSQELSFGDSVYLEVLEVLLLAEAMKILISMVL
jgi:hypothetical protein